MVIHAMLLTKDQPHITVQLTIAIHATIIIITYSNLAQQQTIRFRSQYSLQINMSGVWCLGPQKMLLSHSQIQLFP
jgi:hypothetical protein